MALAILLTLTIVQNVYGKAVNNHRRVTIHVPYKIKHIYHTHTIIKHIQHDKEDKYEFLGYSVGKPEELKGGEMGMHNPAQPYADLGHSFEDNEHTVVGEKQQQQQENPHPQHNDHQNPNGHPNPNANPQNPMYPDEKPGYVHPDGNEYGFEGAGHHKDDNIGQKIQPNNNYNDGYPGEKYIPKDSYNPDNVDYNFGAKLPGYAKEPEADYNYGPKNLGYGNEAGNNGYNVGPKDGGYVKDVGKIQDPSNAYPEVMNNYGRNIPDMVSGYEMENNYGEKNPGYGREMPESEVDYGYGKGHESYGMRINNYDKDYDFKGHGYRKDSYSNTNNNDNYGAKIPSYSMDKGVHYGKDPYDIDNDYDRDVGDHYGPRPARFPNFKGRPQEAHHTGFGLKDHNHDVRGESIIDGHYVHEGEYDYEQEYDYT